MGELYSALTRHISPLFHYKYVSNSHKKITLHEENDDGNSSSSPYSVDFILSNNDIHDEIFIIKDLETLKTNHAGYIRTDPPKDCDYIIINETKQIIYFIELKNTRSSTRNSIKEQLSAGNKWLHHLLFCSHIDDNYIDDWIKFNIKVKYKHARPSTSKLVPIKIDGKEIYFMDGHKFKLSKFRDLS